MAAYQQLFYGTQTDVNPSLLALHQEARVWRHQIDFGGRYVKNGTWSPFYTTSSSNFQVVALVNGDTPPTTFPLYQSPSLASYLRPYLDSTGKVKIGPLSVIDHDGTGPDQPEPNRASTIRTWCFW